MSGRFSDWNPATNYVQAGMVDGQYANAAFTMLAAGPPRIANIGGQAAVAGALSGSGQGGNQIVYPMGLIQNWNLSHTRQFSRLFEIGSERSYFISGRTVGQLGLGRVFYHGVSLLRLLYAYYEDQLEPSVIPALFPNSGAASTANPHNVQIPPGYENIFVNLASDLFTQPIGLLMYMRDINSDALGAVYFEACYVPNHTMGTDAQGVLIQESAAIQFERAVPVTISALTLTDTLSSNASGADEVETFAGIPGS